MSKYWTPRALTLVALLLLVAGYFGVTKYASAQVDCTMQVEQIDTDKIQATVSTACIPPLLKRHDFTAYHNSVVYVVQSGPFNWVDNGDGTSSSTRQFVGFSLPTELIWGILDRDTYEIKSLGSFGLNELIAYNIDVTKFGDQFHFIADSAAPLSQEILYSRLDAHGGGLQDNLLDPVWNPIYGGASAETYWQPYTDMEFVTAFSITTDGGGNYQLGLGGWLGDIEYRINLPVILNIANTCLPGADICE